MKKLLFILLLLNLTAVTMGDDQNRVMQILAVGKEINATDEQVACAIASGWSAEEFAMGKIRLIGPNKAPKGSPVQISVEGMPEKAAELWRRHPVKPTDVWLELYDRSGERINIFWSSEAGPRTFELIVAENGVEIPTLDIATYHLQYGETTTDPVTSIPEPDTPSAELQTLIEPLVAYDFYRKGVLDTGDLVNLTEFYLDFADVISRDGGNVVDTTTMFRNVYINAGTLMFQQTGMKGKYEGLNDIVDTIISTHIGLKAMGFDEVKTHNVLNAVAWAFYQHLEK